MQLHEFPVIMLGEFVVYLCPILAIDFCRNKRQSFKLLKTVLTWFLIRTKSMPNVLDRGPNGPVRFK